MKDTAAEVPPIPQEAKAAAIWIWEWQDRLNQVTLGTGTIAIGSSNDAALRLDAGKKYLRAFASEGVEYMENFYWKHWSKEGRSLLYFDLVDHPEKGDRAEHAQNAKVELVDLVFFLVSLLQSQGISHHVWTACWASSYGWEAGRSLEGPFSPAWNQLSVDHSLRAQALLTRLVWPDEGANPQAHAEEAVRFLRDACALHFSMEEMNEAYAKKLQINFNRQARGRQQVGDRLADQENQGI